MPFHVPYSRLRADRVKRRMQRDEYDGPTYVYLLESEEFDAYKVGITGVHHRTRNRIDLFGPKGWELVHKVEYPTRREARAAERAIVDSWRDLGCGPAVTADQMKYGGETETVSRAVNKF